MAHLQKRSNIMQQAQLPSQLPPSLPAVWEKAIDSIPASLRPSKSLVSWSCSWVFIPGPPPYPGGYAAHEHVPMFTMAKPKITHAYPPEPPYPPYSPPYPHVLQLLKLLSLCLHAPFLGRSLARFAYCRLAETKGSEGLHDAYSVA